MFDIFGQIKGLLKTAYVCIDNNVFRLHYRLTVVILMTFSLIIGSRKYFGDPIDCTAKLADERIVDNFCWFNSYIIVPKDPDDPYPGEYHRYRPVINTEIQDYEKLLNDPNSKYKPYFLHAYQWIEFIMFLQAVFFFIPRYLWRYCWEQGKVKALIGSVDTNLVKQNDSNKQEIENIVKYLKQNKFDHFEYAWKFIVCEVLNFVNVLVQFCILKSQLGLSWEVLIEDFFSSTSNVKPESPLNLIFPNVARCEVPAAGGASTAYAVELCVLPVNVFTTKMYIFLWFHFSILSFVSGIALLYRLATVVSSQFRCFHLKRTGQITEDCIRAVKNIGFGEWFLIDLLGKNMSSNGFRNLIKEYNDALVASRPSFAFVGDEKIYNADLAAMHSLKKDSEK